ACADPAELGPGIDGTIRRVRPHCLGVRQPEQRPRRAHVPTAGREPAPRRRRYPLQPAPQLDRKAAPRGRADARRGRPPRHQRAGARVNLLPAHHDRERLRRASGADRPWRAAVMQRQQQPPPWDDERAVEKLAESDLVSAPIEAMKARVQAESTTVGVVEGIARALASRRSRPRKLSSRRKTEEFDLAGCERDVIEAFDERGDIVPLIKLISWLPPKDTARLSPATLRLIVELLLENLP